VVDNIALSVKIVEACTGSGKTSWPAGAPFVTDSTNPRDFYLPHNEWRKYQLETLLWLTANSPHRVVSLVRNKSLQSGQYDKEYKFDAHYGRANFRCIHPKAPRYARCSECIFLDSIEGMRACPVSQSCPYLVSKRKAMNSKKASLNYAYWMTANGWRNQYPPQMLFCDEAHNLSEIVLNWVSITITEDERREWNLGKFKTIDSSKGQGVFIRDTASPVNDALTWLEDAFAVMMNHCLRLEKEMRGDDKSNGSRKGYLRATNLRRKIGTVIESLSQCPHDWFIKSGIDARTYRGEAQPGFICKPLTARHHARNYFTGKFDTIMMSATIGDPKTFARELGIKDYEFRAIPNQWPAESRPIHVLDCPPMGYKKSESEKDRDARFDKQADVIAAFIKEYPSDWCGLVHVTRKREEVNLTSRLASRGFDDRVWYVPGKVKSYIPTDDQLRQWNDRLERVPNSILVTASFGEGYDGLRERLNISAKIPYHITGNPGSYEYAWMKHSKKRYDQVAAIILAQQQGRNRRGRECDYDTPDDIRGGNAIADGSFGRVRDKLPVGIQESLVE